MFFFFFIKVPVQSQESERSYICVLGQSILTICTIFLLGFGTVWYFVHYIVTTFRSKMNKFPNCSWYETLELRNRTN